jgi:predicted hotdog family 3-hydroxylacyl-ACP dehydratase
MLASKENITRFIPQRDPMVMIHELLEVSETHAITRFSIDTENIFVNRSLFSESGLVENIAQTAAVHAGYQCTLKKIPVPVGYIAAVKHLRIYSLPKQNSSITTSVRITNQVLDVTVAEGKVEQDGNLCCSCEMRIFVKLQP